MYIHVYASFDRCRSGTVEGMDDPVNKDTCCNADGAGGWGSYAGDCERCPDMEERVTLETKLDQPNGVLMVFEH